MFRVCEFIWHCNRHRRHRTLTRTTTRFLQIKILYLYNIIADSNIILFDIIIDNRVNKHIIPNLH